MPQLVSPSAEASVPVVTVVLPVFNAGRFLRAAVQSIAQQTYRDWELLIIDDGSTDAALETISDIDDTRIRIVRDGSNKGLAARLNEGIDLARGLFFARMDQDDIAYPERLARQVQTLEENPGLDLVAARCLTISPENEPVGMLPYAETHEAICARPWLGFYLPHPTWMGRIEWFRKYRYTIPEPHLCEDQDLLTRSYTDSRFAVIPETLLAYRIARKKSLKKLWNTRYSVLCMQLRNFMHSRNVVFALLAVLMFVMRLITDLLNALLPEGRQAGHHRAKQIEDTELAKWRSVRESLHV